MAEAAGVALGVVGVAGAFKGAIDTALFIGSFFDKGKAEYDSVILEYHVQQVRLQLWGDHCKATDSDNHAHHMKSQSIKNLIVRILGQIQKLNEDIKKLAEKYGIDTSMTQTTATDLDKNLHPGSDLAKEIAKKDPKEIKPKHLFSWVAKTRSEIKEKINEIETNINHLYDITLQTREIQLLDNSLEGPVLAPITREYLLQILTKTDTKTRRPLALSARTKLLLSKISLNPGLVTYISRQQLTLVQNSPKPNSIYSLRCHDEQHITVRIEWNELSAGSGRQEYVDRINSLGYILEQVSEPDLRLPPCYGVFDDVEYEKNNGMKRLGYVFGIPDIGSASQGQEDAYDSDILRRPPTSLRDLIQNKKVRIPFLGKRFELAFALACAFGRFHAAGWLHKGFHSGNILFFHKRGEQGVNVAEPFITGFQYSRPQGANSLSSSPLDNSSLDCYYHPHAERGFTRRLDLYSLGVVLYEIGRWQLVADQQVQCKDRTQWHKYLSEKGYKDLGWRMGEQYQSVVKTLLNCDLPPNDDIAHEYFAQQYLDKVTRPLSSCTT
ncbi:prion-inhibition and propagation-domain-containing protein [Annulohypoxylon moriforme]|nr:prion-inhibition and propagation-domain-containing protein [Annulohypoxylon moriforme]